MKKMIAEILLLLCVSIFLAGMALASAPDAMSYFTSSDYNKTYTGEDGLEHTMTVTKVVESWNKVGTVIYRIYYTDTYQDGDAVYTGAKSAYESYDNARPLYPNNSEYKVYAVEWYVDGSSAVVYDYRTSEEVAATPSAQIPTTTPVQTPIPTPVSTIPTPTVKPSAVPTVTANTKTEETEQVAESASETAVISPSPSGTSNTDPATEESANPVTQTDVAAAVADPAASPSEKADIAATNPSGSGWVWITIALAGIGGAVALACFLRWRRKDDHDKDNPEA